jgi:type I restriction enzyme M protein
LASCHESSDAKPSTHWLAEKSGGCDFFKVFTSRDKASLDIFWLRDESLEESDNLPDPEILAQEIVEDLEAALEQLREIAMDLGGEHANPKETKETNPHHEDLCI